MRNSDAFTGRVRRATISARCRRASSGFDVRMYFAPSSTAALISSKPSFHLATATMPYIAPMVEMDGRRYLDGGCSCNVPYQWALDQGYRKIVVIKTHDATYRNVDPKEKNTARRVYRRHQEFAAVLDYSDIRYNAEYADLDRLASEGRIFIVQPSQVVTVGRVERDVGKLGDLYWMGYNDAAACLEELKGYLFS